MARIRQESGLTQQQIADRIGVDLRTVRRWENGMTPSGRSLIKLAGVLGCRAEDLLAKE